MPVSKVWIIIIACWVPLLLKGQHKIQGQVIDEFGDPLVGANAYLKDSFLGATTDSSGYFSFTSSLDTGTLIVSYLGYKKVFRNIHIQDVPLKIKMLPNQTEMGVVTIVAGTFEASDEKKGVVLNSLDIATTAGANADVYAALLTLPGTQRVGETGELFVRGGAGNETRTFIDGLRVQNPFNGSVPDIPSRGRFSPFLFKGTIFSTGGYSAEYGQALSSILALETQDLAEESVTGLSLMSVGAEVSHTLRLDNQSMGISSGYSHLGPYFQLIPQLQRWDQSPHSFNSQINYRKKSDKGGLIKILGNYQYSNMKLSVPSFDTPDQQAFYSNKNDYLYLNSSFQEILGNSWLIHGGANITQNQEQQAFERGTFSTHQLSGQVKVALTFSPHPSVNLKLGHTTILENYHESFTDTSTIQQTLRERYSASYLESEWQISPLWAARIGLRWEYSDIISQQALSPRLSIAYKTSKHSHLSMAWGHFAQTPAYPFMRNTQDLAFEQAEHLILQYQYQADKRIFRIEGYYKNYQHLIRYMTEDMFTYSNVSSTGYGYAKGIDLFWRDRNSLKNVDYWISYSFLDTQRLFQHFPQTTTPGFASKHNLSVVGKYYVSKTNTQIGATYAYTSPRNYHDPNDENFFQRTTTPFQDFSINISYLTQLWGNFTIIYTSITNVLGSEQVFGYRYANYEDIHGSRPGFAIRPPAKRFLFLGIFISFT